MSEKPLQQKFETIAKMLAVVFAFSLPISTAASNIFLGSAFLFWLLGGNFRYKFKLVRQNPVALVALLFSVIYTIGLTYGVIDKSSLSDIWRILLIPIFISLLYQKKWQLYSLYAFLLSLVIILLLSYLLWFDLLPTWKIWKGTPDNPTPFALHITHNLFMAFGAFIFATLAIFSNPTKAPLRMVFYLVAVLMLFNVLFMVQGRTGHVVAAALSLLLFWWLLKTRNLLLWLRIGVMLFVILFFVGAVITPSSAFHQRFTLAFQELEIFKKEPAARASIPERLSWIKNTIDIIKQNPAFGVGTGGFSKAYARHVQGTEFVLTDNPHNEYVMISVQLGIIGLLAFLALFITSWRMAVFIPGPTMGLIGKGLVLTFVVASAVTSTLFDHAEGLLFYWLSGLLFAGLPKKYVLQNHFQRYWRVLLGREK